MTATMYLGIIIANYPCQLSLLSLSPPFPSLPFPSLLFSLASPFRSQVLNFE